MITLISFIILIAGAANWLIIGLMQYDFVAGIFGTQSSLLSRLVYILIGFAAIWIVVMVFAQKGRIKINDNGFKKLNQVAPTKNQKGQNNNFNNNHSNSHSFENNHGSNKNKADSHYNNYEYSSQQHQNPPQNNHEYSHPNTTDAGSEFHSQNPNQRKNPFD